MIITSKEELEKHLIQAREDIAYGRTVSFEYMKQKLNKVCKEKELCMK